jgi:hypothetical protein
VPASGSEYPIEKWISPAAIRGRKNAFCSSVPNRMIVGPTVLMVRKGTGTRAAAASSVKMSWSNVVPPRPPYSTGHPSASHPSRPSCRTTDRYACPSPRSSSPPASAARTSGVISSPKYPRSSRRSRSCSAV